ncbi:MAG: 3-hydroxyacyl-CoA dehydrogenase NAD-binding domain-containing protein [Syntrophales bacterium]|nr:3-hydroxyacyl-CoA dehydrogenase NAD-binding domain-containing protein [Syntrophales bacterium]
MADRPLDRVAVIGAGVLGTQIAMLAAHAGYQVKIYDPVADAFDKTYQKIWDDLKAKGITTPLIPWEKWEEAKNKVQRVTSVDEAVQDAQLVIEAVFENIELKNKVFKELGEKSPPDCILATNSSSIPVSKMADASGRPERCLNIHFYFPLQGVNMVDIMGGTKTLPEVFKTGVKWIISVNCIPLKVNKEILGFCFNRVWRAIKREVLYMWGNGYVDFRDSDRAWRVFTGMKEGPFALMDKVGLDTIYDIEMVYYNESKMPHDKPPDALLEMIKRGELGVKSGKGFYTYPDPEFLRPDFMTPKED